MSLKIRSQGTALAASRFYGTRFITVLVAGILLGVAICLLNSIHSGGQTSHIPADQEDHGWGLMLLCGVMFQRNKKMTRFLLVRQRFELAP